MADQIDRARYLNKDGFHCAYCEDQDDPENPCPCCGGRITVQEAIKLRDTAMISRTMDQIIEQIGVLRLLLERDG